MHWAAIEITTERLAIKPFSASDASDAFSRITSTLTRYLSFDPAPSPEAFESIWRTWLPKIEAGVDFAFVIRLRDTGDFIGLAGLHRTGDPEPELGIWIREDKQDRGYGREAVQAVAAWAAETFAPATFMYPVAKENVRSRRLAEALGGAVVGERTAAKYDSVIYRIPAVSNQETTMSNEHDRETAEFEAALLRSAQPATAGQYANVHTPEDISGRRDRPAN